MKEIEVSNNQLCKLAIKEFDQVLSTAKKFTQKYDIAKEFSFNPNERAFFIENLVQHYLLNMEPTNIRGLVLQHLKQHINKEAEAIDSILETKEKYSKIRLLAFSFASIQTNKKKVQENLMIKERIRRGKQYYFSTKV